jgi:hypothetical protein
MKTSPTSITIFVEARYAKAFNEALKVRGAVFIEKTAVQGGFNITYTVPTLCKEAVVALLKKSGFSMAEARQAYPGLFAEAKKKVVKDEEDDDEDEDDEDGDEEAAASDDEDDDEDEKEEGSKDWKSQSFNGEPGLPTMQKRNTKSDSVVVKVGQTFRIPGTNQIVAKGESLRVYPRKIK